LAFDFDVLYTKSITQALDAVRALDRATHDVLVIDSISHIWDATIAAYTGKKTHPGFPSFNVLAGGPGSLAERSAS
jgi:hypothetical protein